MGSSTAKRAAKDTTALSMTDDDGCDRPLLQFQLAFSLAPWLQPGGSSVPRKSETVLNGFPVFCLATGQRAKAAVLMKAKFIQTTSVL